VEQSCFWCEISPKCEKNRIRREYLVIIFPFFLNKFSEFRGIFFFGNYLVAFGPAFSLPEKKFYFRHLMLNPSLDASQLGNI
jgi:hypothetical protein